MKITGCLMPSPNQAHPAVSIGCVPLLRVVFQYSYRYADVKVNEYKVSGEGAHDESRKRPQHARDME